MTEIYTRFDVTTLGGGRVHLRMETNDDNDDGVPDGEITIWERDMSLETAKGVAGKSRIGIYGHKVDVYIDGIKYT